MSLTNILEARPEPVVDPGRPGEETEQLERSLLLGHRLLTGAEAFAASLDLPDIGMINLPPVVGSVADQALLRATAPLYLAAELEATRLLPAAEMLAGAFATGGVVADLGPAAPLLAGFWQTRHQRLTRDERRAIFARLFGSPGVPLAVPGGSNTGFDPVLLDLAEALHRRRGDRLAGAPPTFDARLRAAAEQVAANLAPRSGGIAVYAARDILDAIGQALAIFKQRPVQAAVGASSPWLAVRHAAWRYLGEEVDVQPHLRRGRAGMRILAWLADSVAHVDDGPLSTPEDVIDAGTDWLQASLTLQEAMPGRP